jgi:predicted ribosome-associated RNA-binding protein Tma20
LAITASTDRYLNASTRKVEFPGNVQAALINPKMMRMPDPPNGAVGVYNIMDFDAHPLSESTILDNGAATHLVNSADWLVPGTFRPADSTDTVEAGT